MKPLIFGDLSTLCWRLKQRQRRNCGHPESIHTVTMEFPTNNLWLSNLGNMASLQGVTPETLHHRYLIRGLEADVDYVLVAQSRRIGHTPQNEHRRP